MVLYIDETENDEYFIVCGLLVNSKKDIETAYKQFKNIVSNYRLKPKIKEKIFREFKSFELDKSYQTIKKQMLLKISSINNAQIIFGYVKKSSSFDHNVKQHIYLSTLLKIVQSIPSNIIVNFDAFNNKYFENKIVSLLSKEPNIISISPKDSQLEHGIQFVDNICGVIRMRISNTDKFCFFDQIKHITKMV